MAEHAGQHPYARPRVAEAPLEAATPERPEAGQHDLLADLDFGKIEQMRTVRRESRRAAKPSNEPQMRALRRILGDVVMEIFPPDLMKSVDAVHARWLTHPDEYHEADFDSIEDMNNALVVMRAYAECADNGGYTIRTVDPEKWPVLTWRAQKRRVPKDDG